MKIEKLTDVNNPSVGLNGYYMEHHKKINELIDAFNLEMSDLKEKRDTFERMAKEWHRYATENKLQWNDSSHVQEKFCTPTKEEKESEIVPDFLVGLLKKNPEYTQSAAQCVRDNLKKQIEEKECFCGCHTREKTFEGICGCACGSRKEPEKCRNCNGVHDDYYGKGYPCDQCDSRHIEKEPEILPCPFCASQPKMRDSIRHYYDLYCPNMKCILNNCTNYFSTKKEAIAAWNRRAK